jgi:hypothetical protein
MTALAQISATASQEAPMPQRQVMGTSIDQLPNAPPQPTPPPMERVEGAGREDPDEITPPPMGKGEPPVEAMVSAPLANELPPQAVSIDMPVPPISTLTILVKGSGHTLSFILSPDTTIAFLKQSILMATGVPPSRQVLSFRDKDMHVPETLRDHNLAPNNNIDLSLSTMDIQENATPNLLSMPILMAPTAEMPQKTDTDMIQFFVKTLNGSSLTMRDSHDTTGGQLKARLQAKTGIPADQQRLTYIKEIRDLATLREISLQDSGTIHMSLRLKGGMEEANTQRQIQATPQSTSEASALP